MGFLEKVPGPVEEMADGANTATTIAGGVDAITRAAQNNVHVNSLRSANQAAAGARGIPGSKALGLTGAALAGIGLADDLFDMVENGIGVENGVSALTNAAGTLGAVSPVAGAFAAGASLGTAGDKALGTSDMVSDWAMSVHEACGGGAGGAIAGGLTTLGGSALMAIPTGLAGAVELGKGLGGAAAGVGRKLIGRDHSLLSGAGAQVAAARDRGAKR